MSGLAAQLDGAHMLTVLQPGGLNDAADYLLASIVRAGAIDEVNGQCPGGAAALNASLTAAINRP